MSKIVNPLESPVKNPKGRLYCVLFWGVIIVSCVDGLLYRPVAKVSIDDPTHTAKTLRYYQVSGVGIPIRGIDYSGEPVYCDDVRLQFLDPIGYVGFVEKIYNTKGELLAINRSHLLTSL